MQDPISLRSSWQFSRKSKSVLSALVLTTFGACSSEIFEPAPHIVPVETDTMLSAAGSVQRTLVSDPATRTFVCDLPQPDAALDIAESGHIGIGLATGVQDSGSATANVADNNLGGRDTSVLITREMFYRTCEFSRNYRLTKDEAHRLFLTTLQVAKEGWKESVNYDAIIEAELRKTTSISKSLSGTISQQ